MYKKDSKHCSECLEFWDKMEKDKEEHIQELQQMIITHLAVETKKKHYYYGKGEKKAEELKKKYYYGKKEKKVE
jgi:hypothetical protein